MPSNFPQRSSVIDSSLAAVRRDLNRNHADWQLTSTSPAGDPGIRRTHQTLSTGYMSAWRLKIRGSAYASGVSKVELDATALPDSIAFDFTQTAGLTCRLSTGIGLPTTTFPYPVGSIFVQFLAF